MIYEIIEGCAYTLNAESVEIYRKVESYIEKHHEGFEIFKTRWSLVITENVVTDDFIDGRVEELLIGMIANIKRTLSSHFDFLEIVITKPDGDISVTVNTLVVDEKINIIPQSGLLCKYEDNIFIQEALLNV